MVGIRKSSRDALECRKVGMIVQLKYVMFWYNHYELYDFINSKHLTGKKSFD